MSLSKLKSLIKRATLNLIKLVQAILMFFLLTFIYFVGFGVTFIMLAIFKPRVLKDGSRNDASFWKVAKDYNADLEDGLRQS